MIFKTLGSSSLGNCYTLKNNEEILVIEAGISSREVLKSINFNLKSIIGVLITHEHKDHSKYENEWIKKGVPVYMTAGTQSVLNAYSHNVHIIQYLTEFKISNFSILPFKTIHDCIEPCGFIINHMNCGNILFATDTCYLPYKFRALNHIFIECNYSNELLTENDCAYKDRVYSKHMSLETCVEALRANDLLQVDNIVLLHLSNNHSDEELFKRKVQSQTGILTYIADKGLEIELNKF